MILLTNDDGIEAPGIKELYNGLKNLGRLYVVAPAVDQSASSHSFSLRKPIRVWQKKPRWFAVYGTPTDCLLISHHGILKRSIDLVISGINNSPNLGDDVLYSGTVAAAIEGAILGMPSVAISYLETGKNEKIAIRLLRSLVRLLLDGFLPKKTLLNINIPAGEIKGIKVTRLGRRIYQDMAVKKALPDGGVSYTIDGKMSFAETRGSDFEAVYSGYISITPLYLDMTHHRELARLEKALVNLGPLA